MPHLRTTTTPTKRASIARSGGHLHPPPSPTPSLSPGARGPSRAHARRHGRGSRGERGRWRAPLRAGRPRLSAWRAGAANARGHALVRGRLPLHRVRRAAAREVRDGPGALTNAPSLYQRPYSHPLTHPPAQPLINPTLLTRLRRREMGPTRVLRGSHSAVEQRAFGGAARRSGDFIRAREGAAACALLDTGEAPPTATRVEPGMRMCMRPQASRDYFN